jgi:hypothetical protein
MIRFQEMFWVGTAALFAAVIGGAAIWFALVAYTRIAYASLGVPSPL